jgi:exonuclease VII small subunit
MAKADKRMQRRPFINAARAAELLGCDPRTVRKWVERGEIQGEKVPSINDRFIEWRIFTDQPLIEEAQAQAGASAAPVESDRHTDEVAELRAQLAELRAQQAEERARSAEAQNTQVVAALHAMNEVLGEFQRGAELAQQSNTHFQSGSATMSKVMSALLDALAADSTPDSPAGL